jgi:cell division protein FtsB
LNKLATTYWDNPQTISLPVGGNRKSRVQCAAADKSVESTMPQWLVFAVVASMTLMLCLAINLRAYAVMTSEAEQNQRLNVEIEQLTSNNLAIQEEVHNLRTDARSIEREAKKIGLNRPFEKVSLPLN